jgi:hypothetical protein
MQFLIRLEIMQILEKVLLSCLNATGIKSNIIILRLVIDSI